MPSLYQLREQRHEYENIEGLHIGYLENGGPTMRQSFRLAELLSPRQLQSYTAVMEVVADSFFTGW